MAEWRTAPLGGSAQVVVAPRVGVGVGEWCGTPHTSSGPSHLLQPLGRRLDARRFYVGLILIGLIHVRSSRVTEQTHRLTEVPFGF